MRCKKLLILLAGVLAAAAAGCRAPAVTFPTTQLPGGPADSRAYDTDNDGRADFFMYLDADGRIDRIGYATDPASDANNQAIVDLDAIPAGRCRHLVIILDGFGYDVVRRYYDSGHLRLFHRPTIVVADYPTLTDPCIEDLLGYIPCRAMEARYFDRRTNHDAGGAMDYMNGVNEPYNRLLDYRANLLWDAIGYVYSWPVYNREINNVKRLFDQRKTKETLVYLVSSACVGTDEGEAGQVRCLQRVDQLVNQVVFETRGLTKVTLLADHGHTYTPGRRIDLEGFLKSKGWRPAESLKEPRDVVYIRFGLLTYASFATQRPADLAADLTSCKGVQLASYADGQSVIVLAGGGQRAVIDQRDGRFRYRPTSGDPLKLAAILGTLQADADGFIDADALLVATVDHEYPAPLQRLWRAHFSLVENAPDVIVSLDDDCFAGSDGFAGTVHVASTHGGLDKTNSRTFIMSTAGPLTGPMRSADVPRKMSDLLGRPWPGRP